MKATSVWVIVPFSRPQHLQNTIDNFVRQEYQNKKLIIVENGGAVGTCKQHGFEPDVLLTSNNHQADAKNEGLNYLRNHGGGFWATYDDDDYYGPKYLAEMVEASDKADMVGKGDFFVRMAGGTLRSFEGIGCNEQVRFVHGPTICSWAEICRDFPNTGRIGEDCALLREMMQEGATIWATSKFNFIFHRYPEQDHHTWQISDVMLTESLSRGMGFDPVVKDYGKNIPYAYVNGLSEEPEHEVLDAGFNDGYILEELDKLGLTERFTKQVLIEQGFLKEGEDPDEKLKKINVSAIVNSSFNHVEVFQVEDDDLRKIDDCSEDGRGLP